MFLEEENNFKARVSFCNRTTPQKVRTSILHALQAQGYLKNVTRVKIRQFYLKLQQRTQLSAFTQYTNR